MSRDRDIGIDIDGVICNFQSGLIERAEEMGLEFYDHWTQWKSWETDYPENFEKVLRTTKDDSGFWYRLRPFDHAQKGEDGWLPFTPKKYVTSRPLAPEGITEEWLFEKYNFPECEVHVVDSWEEKREVVDDLDAYIDDKILTILSLQTGDEKYPIQEHPVPILFSMPWNDYGSDADRVEDIAIRFDNLTDMPDF
jgi:hypothetical protein